MIDTEPIMEFLNKYNQSEKEYREHLIAEIEFYKKQLKREMLRATQYGVVLKKYGHREEGNKLFEEKLKKNGWK